MRRRGGERVGVGADYCRPYARLIPTVIKAADEQMRVAEWVRENWVYKFPGG
jgi:hypothetical protein